MATYTHSPDMGATIWVGKDAKLSKINRNIYGGFLEYALPSRSAIHRLIHSDTSGAASTAESMTLATASRTKTVSGKT